MLLKLNNNQQQTFFVLQLFAFDRKRNAAKKKNCRECYLHFPIQLELLQIRVNKKQLKISFNAKFGAFLLTAKLKCVRCMFAFIFEQ